MNLTQKVGIICLFVFAGITVLNAQTDRWKIADGQRAVVWPVHSDDRLPHADNVEMSGRKISAIIEYAVDSARMVGVNRRLIFPQRRVNLKDTDPDWWAVYRNYLRRDYSDDDLELAVYFNDRQYVHPAVDSIRLDGLVRIYHTVNDQGIRAVRSLYPHPEGANFQEHIAFVNTSGVPVRVGTHQESSRDSRQYRDEVHQLGTRGAALENHIILAPGDSLGYLWSAFAANDGEVVAQSELLPGRQKREAFVAELGRQLTLETPEPVYNTLFHLSKIRGAESIFDSKLGLVHSPGGGRYYTGFWANDQAEYINPFFPYLGNNLANAAALNMWRVYQQAIPKDGSNIRYSFEMAGDAPANPLDRGDAAMIAYGLSHYLLANGNPAIAEELWPLLSWCLEYNHRQLNAAGVVKSESDEMEGRIATGDANLSTSTLYYGALETSLSVAEALGRDDYVRTLRERRERLLTAIREFFGATVEGLDAYRYYDGHTKLRHWIALPLVVGIHDRKEDVLTGLFDRLWTENGVHVEKNSDEPGISEIFWDRGTLYALRGGFIAGATQRTHQRLLDFSRRRLLGERVPYMVEAFPEGNMAHLSAESGLYCRIFTEGLFGLLPTGFRSFRLRPVLPEGWERMALRNIRAFGQEEGFDIEVERGRAGLNIHILRGEQVLQTFTGVVEAVEVSPF